MSGPAPPACRRRVDVDGPVHYMDMGGPKAGPLLVCVHGLGRIASRLVAAVGPSLSRHARVVAVDLVGHGLTPTGAADGDIEGHRRLLSGFLDALGGSPAILVGNSMGGLVAALQAVSEPASVAGLVLVDPALPTTGSAMVHPPSCRQLPRVRRPRARRALPRARRRPSAEQTVEACSPSAASTPPGSPPTWSPPTSTSPRTLTGTGRRRLPPLGPLVVLADGPPPGPPSKLDGSTSHPAHPRRPRPRRSLSAAPAGERRPSDWRFEIAPDVGHVPMLEAPEWTAAHRRLAGRRRSAAAAPASRLRRATPCRRS